MWWRDAWSAGATTSPAHWGPALTVGSRPMWCTAMDTFCTMWKRSPATVMVLPPLWGDSKPREPRCSPRECPGLGSRPGLSHLTWLRRGLMAVMTGFRLYQKVRLPRTQPRCSKRTHTGTGAGRAPPGTVQVMLVSVRLRRTRASSAGTRLCHSPATNTLSPGARGLGSRPAHLAPTSYRNLVSTFPLPHLCLGCLPHLGCPAFSLTCPIPPPPRSFPETLSWLPPR